MPTPVDQRATRDQIWDGIRQLRVFGCKKLCARVGSNHDQTGTYLLWLCRAGILSREKVARHGQCDQYRYTLEKDYGVIAPRVRRDGTLVAEPKVETLWRTIKVLKEFTIHELLMNANMSGKDSTRKTVKDYAQHLCKAGYLIRIKDGHYRFVETKNTGPRPPMIQRTKQVYDQNLNEVVWPCQ